MTAISIARLLEIISSWSGAMIIALVDLLASTEPDHVIEVLIEAAQAAYDREYMAKTAEAVS